MIKQFKYYHDVSIRPWEGGGGGSNAIFIHNSSLIIKKVIFSLRATLNVYWTNKNSIMVIYLNM